MNIAETQRAWCSNGKGGGGHGHIRRHFHWSQCQLTQLHMWSFDWREDTVWSRAFIFYLCGHDVPHYRRKDQKKKKNGRMTNWLSPERQEHLHSHCQYHLCSVSLWLSLFLAFFPLNCLIIHLRALIYPPSSALYVRPLCETFSWISNELVAYKVFLPGKAPIYGHVCLFSININPLGEERPYAIFSRTVPGTSLGRKSHCSVSLVSQRLLGWKYKIINFVFSIRTHDL